MRRSKRRITEVRTTFEIQITADDIRARFRLPANAVITFPGTYGSSGERVEMEKDDEITGRWEKKELKV